MSRNFELLTQVQPEFGGFGAPGKGIRSTSGVITTASEEILPLVQRVFLSGNAHQVLFCGVDKENGSSSVCERAGRALAEHNSRPVCLIDGNLLSHHLCTLLGVDTSAAPVAGSSIREQCVQVGDNLWLAPTTVIGSNVAFLPLEQLKERLQQLRAEFEYLLIDAAGVNVRGDAALLGQVADGTVLVIEANSTRRVAARRAKETLDATKVRLLGTVLHNRTFPIPEQLYRNI